MKTRVPSHWFRRVLIRSGSESVGTMGFVVRFPGSTTSSDRRWLKAHGYEYTGKTWCRVDRKPSRMTRAEADVHADRVKDRRRVMRARSGR